jgi:hypothetical protein
MAPQTTSNIATFLIGRLRCSLRPPESVVATSGKAAQQ